MGNVFRGSYRTWLGTLAIVTSVDVAWASYCTDTSVEVLTATPYTSHWDAYTRLSCLEEHFVAAGDRRAIFASVYTLTTLRMAQSIDAGTYADTNWMRAYQTIFANYYRQALHDYELGNYGDVPESWLLAFDAAASGETLILQDVILGMNAHINRDLAYAVEDVGISPNRATKKADHTLVNQTLAEVADEVIAALSSIYGSNYDLLDTALGPTDELFLAAGFVTIRENAWNNAVSLTNSRWWNRWIVEGFIESGANTTANLTLALQLAPGLLATLRALEGSNPGSTFCQAFPCD